MFSDHNLMFCINLFWIMRVGTLKASAELTMGTNSNF